MNIIRSINARKFIRVKSFSTEQKLGIFARSKELFRKYWWPCTIAYSALYCGTLGIWFTLLDMKLLNIAIYRR